MNVIILLTIKITGKIIVQNDCTKNEEDLIVVDNLSADSDNIFTTLYIK